MAVLKQASRMLNIDIGDLVDFAADPGTKLDELIRDLEELMTALQHEEAEAVERQKGLLWRVTAAKRAAREYEGRATRAFESGDAVLGRRMATSGAACETLRTTLSDQLERSVLLTARLRSHRVHVRERLVVARHRRHELANDRNGAIEDRQMIAANGAHPASDRAGS